MMFWGSKNPSDFAKYRYIVEVTKDHSLDFVAVTETGKQDMLTSKFVCLSRWVDFIWPCLSPCGSFGGILLSVNANVMH
jgi:hypothetical protein